MESKAYRVYMSDMLLGANNRLIVLNAAWGNPSDMISKRFWDIINSSKKSSHNDTVNNDAEMIKKRFVNAFKG